MAKTILFAWELGSGLGYVARLRRLAVRFQREDVRIVAVLKNIHAARWLEGLALDIMQAPLWPVTFMSDAECARLSTATFADTLAGFGLADERALRALLDAWDRLFSLVKPDLVIAEHAPAATLAARGRLPLALVGTGFTLPPAEMERFPRLHRAHAPVWREEDLLDIVNKALGRFSTRPLDRLPQLFAADVRAVTTFPLLDPYRAQRTEPAQGPFLDRAPTARRDDAETILAYFSAGADARPDLVEALRSLAPRLRLFAPGFSAASRACLAQAGARVEERPMAFDEALAGSRLAIHVGSNGVAAEALAAGVPQLVLSLDIEKELTGGALEQAGAGKLVKLYDPAASVSGDMIAALAMDAGIAERAADLGRSHRQALLERASLPIFETACLRLLPR
jgi:UDP:flavonoid glycosyltransferase YjiC (YdhE family)